VEGFSGLSTAAFDGRLIGRIDPPERFPDEQQTTGSHTAVQLCHRAGHTAADPGGTDTGRDVDRRGRHVPGGVAVHERHVVGDAQLDGSGPGRGDEHGAERPRFR